MSAPNALPAHNAVADAALAAALGASRFDQARAALREGANPSLPLPSGDRPLHLAAARLRFDNPDAFEREAVELIALLLSLGAPPDELSAQGETALIFAARSNQAERSLALLRSGAGPNHLDPEGFRPLDYAAINHNARMALDLLEAGADPSLCFKHPDPGSYRVLFERSPIPALAAAWIERQALLASSPAAAPAKPRGPL